MSGRIGFIGGGRMGSALLKGLIERELVSAEDVTVGDVSKERLSELTELDVSTTSDNREVARASDIIFLCVKPKVIEEVLRGLGDSCNGKLVASIVAGVTSSFIEDHLPGARIVRVMPNTPALVGELAAGYCQGETATEEDAETVGGLLSGLGVAIEVQEELMDAITGLSGSGPAYAYYFINALAKAGGKQGIPEDAALKLSAKTVKGAAEMILSTGKTPDELIDMVASPGGTTIEGMKVLKESDIADVIDETVKAATEKSRKLSK